LLLAALIAISVLPSEAAAVRWVVKGRGFGHGVGMSQYGAYGYAQHGKGYRFILRHYYTGTSLDQVSPRTVRVLLYIEPGNVPFSGATGACGRRLDQDRVYEARFSSGSVVLQTREGRRLAGCGRKLRAHGDGSIRINAQGLYRGALEVVPTRSDPGSLNVINALGVERYLQGVLPGEVPASWPAAALRAQAVAARSYALSSGVDGNGFELYDDTRSQVYGGLDSEEPQTNRAVAATKREVVTYRGEVAQCFFFSTSGGRTENVEYGFIGSSPVPYLKSVRDPYDSASPLHTWRLSFPDATVQRRLAPYVRGRLQWIKVTKRGVSPRIVSARLVGSRGTTTIRGDTLQYALGLYDRWAYFCRQSAGSTRCGGSDSGSGGSPGGTTGGSEGGVQPSG
jgi:stage II sporulation protein D